MKRVSLEQLVSAKGEISYLQQYQYITELMENGKIKPLKASKTNGKKPALYREYWLIEPEKDYSALKEELKYRLHGRIDVDYYLEHPQVYERERPWVLKLSDYLKKSREKLEYKVSVNERSFEIWSREKFLTKEQGKAVLKHCGIGEDFLNTYGTSEPLSYYSSTRRTPQNMVILENKDTFYSMRSHLLGGHERILGMPVGTLIYGAGKGILKRFSDFSVCVEPYMTEKENGIYYFGDLDYEGIGIYERLASLFQEEWEIVPFVSAYERMLKKAEDGGLDGLPETKEQQNRKISGAFFQYFSEESSEKMRAVIESGRYIPQEILNISDFCR
ncbi:MAG: hypothetical protein HFH00_07345 [Dorea sp.]|nr:hypothetical protein [Dorea sp.]